MSAELGARRTAAAAILGDFRREEAASLSFGGASGHDWLALAQRLAWALADLLDELDKPRPRIDGSQAATHVRGDGSAALSHEDLLTVLAALRHAGWWQAQNGDPGMSVRCDGLRWRLGDDR